MRAFIILCLMASSATSATLSCDNGITNVSAPTIDLAEKVCEASNQTLATFEQCDLGAWEPVRIEVVDHVEQDCIGIYHCGENLIEVLSPDALELAQDKLVTFGKVPADRLFVSVLHHELSHALFDKTPCAYDSCVASSEYFAYSQQISALSPEDRAPIVDLIDPNKTVNRDTINAVILFMAPDIFIATTWAHFSDRPDACMYWQSMLSGQVLFDRFHP